MRIVVAISSLCLLLLLAACGGSSTSASPSPGATVMIAASATSATVVAGASQTFSVTVSGTSNTGVTWSIQEGSAGGTIDATGKYTAPMTPGTYHVVATSIADSSRSVTITITVTAVPPAIGISISPTAASVATGATQQFNAAVTGTANAAVNWRVVEGSTGGTIDQSGKFTAAWTPGTYHVVVTSAADATKSTTATVAVTATSASSTWLMQPPVAPPVAGTQDASGAAVTALPNGAVLATGGLRCGPCTSPGLLFYLDYAYLYTVSSNGTVTGTSVGPMLSPRWYHTSTLLADGRVLLADGFKSGGAYASTAEIFDTNTATFKAAGTNPVNRAGSSAFLRADGTVLIAGIDGSKVWSAQIYNPATQTFGAPAAAPDTRNAASVALLADGKLLIAGGVILDSNLNVVSELSTAMLFDPATGTFSPTGSMGTARAYSSATLLSDGTVLVAGGTDVIHAASLASAEIYDPTTGSFSPAGNMTMPRGMPKAVRLANGKVLIVSPLAPAEIYDPQTRTFHATGAMNISVNIGDPPPVLLSNGLVMMFSGFPDAPSDIYFP